MAQEAYRPTPIDQAERSIKKIKFEHVKNDMIAQFSSKNLSSNDITAAISTAFPNTYSRLSTKSRTKHVFGLEEIMTPTSSGEVQSSSREANLMSENQHLRLQILDQQSRIAELEKQVKEKSALSPSQLTSQIDSITLAQYSAYHGPNTIAHFNDFSIDHLIKEFKEHAPDVWQLVNLLGDTERFSENDDLLSVAQQRTTSIMCSLLKCRSQKTVGLQLLISLMLIARSTSRRVFSLKSQNYSVNSCI